MLVTLVFQLCGLQAYAGPRSPFGSSLALLWCAGSCIAYGGVLAFCLAERKWLFADARTGIGINFIPFIKSSVTIVAHLAVLLEALLARGVYRGLDGRLAAVDGTLRGLVGVENVRAGRARFRNKLLLFGAFCGAIELGILAMVYGSRVQRAVWWLTVPSLVVIRMKHLHHAYHIDRLAARFGVLREQLEALVGSPSSPGHRQTSTGEKNAPVVERWTFRPTDALKGPSKSLDYGETQRTDHLRRVLVVKGTYLTLWHAAKDLNGCCVYSQLANLLQNFIQCTCDLYSLYSLLYLNQFDDIFGYILSVVATFTALGIVLAACENCKSQVGQMGQLLHKRRGDEVDLLAKMTENFSLLLQHTPMYFSLGGFFDMDFMLLKEMAAAITTYMVIFIQFMPKEDPAAAVGPSNGGNFTLTNSTLSPKLE
uniref:Gustatory receptor n=1 Tax=Anopheles dirus TaxID=7168 RepID=A0A182NZB8_9DIPT